MLDQPLACGLGNRVPSLAYVKHGIMDGFFSKNILPIHMWPQIDMGKTKMRKNSEREFSNPEKISEVRLTTKQSGSKMASGSSHSIIQGAKMLRNFL